MHVTVLVFQLKDLKRQLHAERKRAEKLQERLQEVLSDSKNKSEDVHQNFVSDLVLMAFSFSVTVVSNMDFWDGEKWLDRRIQEQCECFLSKFTSVRIGCTKHIAQELLLYSLLAFETGLHVKMAFTLFGEGKKKKKRLWYYLVRGLFGIDTTSVDCARYSARDLLFNSGLTGVGITGVGMFEIVWTDVDY